MTIVEIYHSRTSQWHAVSPLPFPRASMTHGVIHSMLYLMGGHGREKDRLNLQYKHKKTVMSTSIPQLLQTCLQPSPTQWQNLPIPNVPNYGSTAASLGGCLLVVGGRKDLIWSPKSKPVISPVHAYCPSTSSWVLVGGLPHDQPLCDCIIATLPTGELMVIGGWTLSSSYFGVINAAYKCSLSMLMQ